MKGEKHSPFSHPAPRDCTKQSPLRGTIRSCKTGAQAVLLDRYVAQRHRTLREVHVHRIRRAGLAPTVAVGSRVKRVTSSKLRKHPSSAEGVIECFFKNALPRSTRSRTFSEVQCSRPQVDRDERS